ncbi:hypothetical protein HWV62_41272 [Athelia sp. TMB]|nr:hypothetical protein HWV62_41272 [Athelia sp. TMB]
MHTTKRYGRKDTSSSKSSARQIRFGKEQVHRKAIDSFMTGLYEKVKVLCLLQDAGQVASNDKVALEADIQQLMDKLPVELRKSEEILREMDNELTDKYMTLNLVNKGDSTALKAAETEYVEAKIGSDLVQEYFLNKNLAFPISVKISHPTFAWFPPTDGPALRSDGTASDSSRALRTFKAAIENELWQTLLQVHKFPRALLEYTNYLNNFPSQRWSVPKVLRSTQYVMDNPLTRVAYARFETEVGSQATLRQSASDLSIHTSRAEVQLGGVIDEDALCLRIWESIDEVRTLTAEVSHYLPNFGADAQKEFLELCPGWVAVMSEFIRDMGRVRRLGMMEIQHMALVKQVVDMYKTAKIWVRFFLLHIVPKERRSELGNLGNLRNILMHGYEDYASSDSQAKFFSPLVAYFAIWFFYLREDSLYRKLFKTLRVFPALDRRLLDAGLLRKTLPFYAYCQCVIAILHAASELNIAEGSFGPAQDFNENDESNFWNLRTSMLQRNLHLYIEIIFEPIVTLLVSSFSRHQPLRLTNYSQSAVSVVDREMNRDAEAVSAMGQSGFGTPNPLDRFEVFAFLPPDSGPVARRLGQQDEGSNMDDYSF